MNKEVRKRRKINIQKVFNLVSFTFILACCVFYGGRFIKLYIENKKTEKITVLADTINKNNENNKNFKKINEEYYFTNEEENNYVKYSNLLWRIIRINSDKSVTVVSENSLASLNPGSEKDYEKTYINKWLNDSKEKNTGILEKNLNNIQKYLTYTNTCKDIVNDTKNITCKDKINNTYITIPSIFDYINTGSDKSFMNNSEYFYLTNQNKENNYIYIDETGKINYSDKEDIMGIKPVITIKNTITAKEGNGSKDNPYTFEEESTLFASYVKLGDDTWRVFDIDEENVKLSLNNYLKINNEEVKYKYSNNGYYHNDTKNGTLAYYLKNNFLDKKDYANIVEETEMANGIYNSSDNFNYIKTLETTVPTKISLLSIGNINLNPTLTNYFTSTGVDKNNNLIYVIQNDFKVYTKTSSTSLKIVPVISIKKSLLTNGNGTENSPYEVQ